MKQCSDMGHWDSQAQEEEDGTTDHPVDLNSGCNLEERAGEVEEAATRHRRVHLDQVNQFGDHPISAWEEPAIEAAEAQEYAGGSYSRDLDSSGSSSTILRKDRALSVPPTVTGSHDRKRREG